MLRTYQKELRKKPTEAEHRLWQHLRNRRFYGFKFRRQHILKQYIVDFVCLEKKLIIELDGGQHSNQIVYDAQRTHALEKLGFSTLRFWNNDVLGRTSIILEVIYEKLKIEAPLI